MGGGGGGGGGGACEGTLTALGWDGDGPRTGVGGATPSRVFLFAARASAAACGVDPVGPNGEAGGPKGELSAIGSVATGVGIPSRVRLWLAAGTSGAVMAPRRSKLG